MNLPSCQRNTSPCKMDRSSRQGNRGTCKRNDPFRKRDRGDSERRVTPCHRRFRIPLVFPRLATFRSYNAFLAKGEWDEAPQLISVLARVAGDAAWGDV